MEDSVDQFDYSRALMAAYMQGDACFRIYVALSAINDYLQAENYIEGLDDQASAVAAIMQSVLLSVQKNGRLTEVSFVMEKSRLEEEPPGPLNEEEIARFIDQIGGTPDAKKEEDD